MTNFEPEEQEEKPLDPALENVRRKMVRLQLVSAGIMFVSLMAVLAAVVYKATKSETREPVASTSLAIPADQPVTATASLPQGFTVQSTALSGSQILFFGQMPDGTRKALVFDITVGRVVADVTVAGQ